MRVTSKIISTICLSLENVVELLNSFQICQTEAKNVFGAARLMMAVKHFEWEWWSFQSSLFSSAFVYEVFASQVVYPCPNVFPCGGVHLSYFATTVFSSNMRKTMSYVRTSSSRRNGTSMFTFPAYASIKQASVMCFQASSTSTFW